MNLWQLMPFGSILLAILPLTTAAEPPTFYVSPQGDDNWSGALDAPNRDRTDGPLATIGGARDALRRWKEGDAQHQADSNRPIVVSIREGAYPVTEPIRFAPQDSGTRTAPVVYRAYPGERPVIDGGRTITGWRQEGKRWVTDIPAVREGAWSFSALWVGGQRCQPARSPNPAHPWGDDPEKGDTYQAAGPFLEKKGAKGEQVKSNTKFRFHPGDLKNSDSLDDAVVVIYHSWATSLMRIKGLDEEDHVVEFTGPARWPYGKWQPDQRYFVEHLYEALDRPGEWHLNRKTGRLTYWPRDGEVLGRTEVVAPATGQLLLLQGDLIHSRFVENLAWEGLTFQHTEYAIAPKGHSDAQAAFAVNGAVEAVGARHCHFRNCVIRATGNHAAWFRTGCQDCSLEQSELFDLGAGGVRVGEGGSPATADEAVLRNIIDNNFIHEGGRIFRSAVGVWIGRSSHNRITHNEICDFRYTGVSVGWSWGYAESSANHNLIAKNHIHHIGLGQLNDMGGIYTLGVSPGTVLRGNTIHDVISHPRLYGGWGLYTDEGSAGILLENNLVYNTTTGSFHQHYGRDNRVVNNIFAYAHGPQIIRSREEDHNSFFFERNIVYFNSGHLLGSTWKNGHWTIDHNCYWDTSGRKVKCAGRAWDQWQAEGHDTHSAITDPRLVAPAQGDFRLRPDSPALPLGFVPWDFNQAGLHGDQEWVARPKRVERPPFSPPAVQLLAE